MPKCLCCLIVVTMACLGATSGSAQTQLKDPRELTFAAGGGLSVFKAKPASQLMQAEDYRNYLDALARRDCNKAHSLLNAAFIRAYPQFMRARLKPNCAQDRDCRYWAHYARVNFMEYGYCTAIAALLRSEHELRQKEAMLPPKFKLKGWRERTLYNDRRVERRDRILAIIIGQAESDYRPALIKLARLVKRGDTFNADKEVEYYLLLRACAISPDCTALAQRLGELRKAIAPERISLIATKAQAKPPKRPRLRRLLLGEKL